MSPHGLTLRSLLLMADARGKWQRQHNVATAALAAGVIKDIRAYLRTGAIATTEQQAPIDDRVKAYNRAIAANGGRFMMPEEVEAWLAANPLPEQ